MDQESDDNKEPTKTEESVAEAVDLYIKQVDPSLILKILLEKKGMTPQKAQTIMRWARAKADDLGWL